MKKAVKIFTLFVFLLLVMGISGCQKPQISTTPTMPTIPTEKDPTIYPTIVHQEALFGYNSEGKNAYDIYVDKHSYDGDKEQWVNDFVYNDLEKEVEGFVAYGIEVKNGIVYFDEPDRIIQIEIETLGSSIPQYKDEGYKNVFLRFSVGDKVLNTYGKIRVQGSSTAMWPKKNFSLYFYSDENRTEEIKIRVGSTIPTNHWIVKAEWIDPTMMRNQIAYKLWDKIVRSRTTTPMFEVNNAFEDYINPYDNGAQGYPVTHTSYLNINKEFYGLTTLLLGHDPANFNIDPNNPNHLYFEFDARGGTPGTKSWTKFRYDSIDHGWIDSYYPKNGDYTHAHKQAIDDLGEFINGSLSNFTENFDTYFDKTNMIDMLIFMEAIYDWDAVAQDIEIITYDLQKWYFLPWDKDTSFGMWWDGRGLYPENSENTLLLKYHFEWEEEVPWYKTYHSFTDDVEARYAQLRDLGILSVQTLSDFMTEINSMISEYLWQLEFARWPDRPSVDEATQEQILVWFYIRLEMLDNHFNYNK